MKLDKGPVVLGRSGGRSENRNSTVRNDRHLLRGICAETIELLRDKQVAQGSSRRLSCPASIHVSQVHMRLLQPF